MKITLESTIDDTAIETFYRLYLAAFEPLRTRAAARHVLTAEEFAADMRDPRIDKYVVRDDAGDPVGLTTLATDLAAVPWISPEHLAARYPEHAARGAVYYLGVTLVHPTRGRGAFALATEAVTRRRTEDRAVCGYDVCAVNDAGHLGRSLAKIFQRDRVSLQRMDVQTYYAADFSAAEHHDAAPPAPPGDLAVAR